jgi:translation initiation factor IF-2
MAESSSYRLQKVAKELNIGLHTIVDHLAQKGFVVEEKPTSKITEEMYNLLLKDYQGDKKAKEESLQISINRTKKEEPVLNEPVKKAKEKFADAEEDDEILIKNASSISYKEEKPAKETTKKSTDAPKIPAKKEAPAPEPEPVAKKAEPKVAAEEVKEDTDKEGKKGLKVMGKIDLEELKPKTKAGKKETAKPVEEPVKATKKSESKKKEKEEEPVAETIATPEKEEEAAPVVAEAEQEIAAEKEESSSEEVNVVKPKMEKLQGLTVLGKINLPQAVDRKKPVASSDNTDALKKKRKRKTTNYVGGTDSTGTPGTTDAPRREFTPGNANRPTGTGAGAPGNRFGRPPLARPYVPKTAGKPAEKGEITEKEIQDKIKATLARLAPGSRKPGDMRSKFRKQKRETQAQSREDAAIEQEKEMSILKVSEFVSASELAKMMNVSVNEIISTCMNLGMMVSINQRLDAETITIVADEFGHEVSFVSAEVQEDFVEEEDNPDDLVERPPIVTVMGHVDHGKTSLLDYIRKANVIAGEAGGITQHIGAYEVELENGKRITFLDTPGHEAFTAMRARGAKLTDIVIIVIAADDSVMPQTKEAISHAQAAGVPIVFALNKIDREGANPEKIKEQLANLNILVEDWGGKYQCQEISAKKGLNIDNLLEKVLLEAELLELKANPNKMAVGAVIESTVDKGRGNVTTIMVQTGTLHVGDPILVGPHSGKVKAMFNERGQKIASAGPSTPVSLLGLNGSPQAGDRFNETATEQEAKEIANKRQQIIREQGIRVHKHITLDEIGRRLAIGNFKELNLIVKGDVDGSVEALSDSLLKLSTEEIQVNVIHKSVGQISESDVLLASASDAIIIGFNVRPSLQARKLAETETIDIRLYSIIYDAIEEIKAAMEGMLAPSVEEKIVATIEVREVFKITKVGTIAGAYVQDGKITRNTKVRLVRDGVVVHTGEIDSLKRFKDDVREVLKGFEFGISLKNFEDIKVGDIIEGYDQVEVKRKLV